MRNRTFAYLPLLLIFSFLAGCSSILTMRPIGGGLAGDLDRIFNDPSAAQGHWGVVVRSLDTGRTIYARNSERLFLPASNAKLLTGAAILEGLGPEYRYATTIAMSGRIINGALEGALVITGTGDPTFSARFHQDPRSVFAAWADSLRANGITRVAGPIIAVDTAFRGPPLGAGWMWDDLLGSSSAPYGALQFNEGVIEIDLYPSSTVFQPAIIVVTPPTQSVRVINDTRTVGEGGVAAIRVLRDENGAGIIVTGEVPADVTEIRRTVAVTDPSAYFISVLRETLREAGILVEGTAIRAVDLEPFDPTVHNAVTLFVHHSPPLHEILPEMMKPSQNQIAETMFITVGRELRGSGTATGAIAVVDSLLRVWDLDPAELRLADGSGLSRYNLVSPRLLADLLMRMDASPHREDWLASLPIAGRDGTLSGRMTEPPLLDHVLAKTGTLSSVRALSGYLTARNGRRYVFSILANHNLVPASQVDRLVETALLRIAEEP